MVGNTTEPGQNSADSFVIGPITSSRSAEDSLSVGGSSWVTTIWSSASTRSSAAFTSSTGSPGITRQLTLAVANCGSALIAGPASSSVATQVVRNCALKNVLAASRATAGAAGSDWPDSTARKSSAN